MYTSIRFLRISIVLGVLIGSLKNLLVRVKLQCENTAIHHHDVHSGHGAFIVGDENVSVKSATNALPTIIETNNNRDGKIEVGSTTNEVMNTRSDTADEQGEKSKNTDKLDVRVDESTKVRANEESDGGQEIQDESIPSNKTTTSDLINAINTADDNADHGTTAASSEEPSSTVESAKNRFDNHDATDQHEQGEKTKLVQKHDSMGDADSKLELPKTPFQDKDRAWCILNTSSAVHWTVDSIPHILQALFPCWSDFNQYRRQNHPNDVKCSFLLSDDPLLDKNNTVLTLETSLGYKLLQAMECTVVVGDESILRQYKVDSSRIHYHKFEKNTERDVTWFSNMEDAHDLRDRFLALYGSGITNSTVSAQAIGDDSNSNKNNNKDSPPPPLPTRLQIGLLNRNKTRAILNMDEIESELHQVFPAADIDYTYFEGKEYGWQAEWFATKDVIFSPHGAAITWSAFIQSNTIVIQAYPQNYYPNKYFEPLIRIAGGHAYDWHLGDTPFLDYQMNSKEHEKRKFWRSQSFSVPVQEAMDIFINATKAHKTCESKTCF